MRDLQGLIFVRGGKGDKDRSTLLPNAACDRLREQVRTAEGLHRRDRQAGVAGVWLPDALERKNPRAGLEIAWFWVFPSQTPSLGRTGPCGYPEPNSSAKGV